MFGLFDDSLPLYFKEHVRVFPTGFVFVFFVSDCKMKATEEGHDFLSFKLTENLELEKYIKK